MIDKSTLEELVKKSSDGWNEADKKLILSKVNLWKFEDEVHDLGFMIENGESTGRLYEKELHILQHIQVFLLAFFGTSVWYDFRDAAK